ncbi:MAG TPA: Holliday junction resolvase RuvX [Candidatus Eisenbacteria bacterium]|nr:Holliday junction resolvase RuvX [Candidatus Eisenbacteria bacterium]
MPRVLAVDWGERRVGLAVSDPTGTIASGLPTLIVRSLEQAVEGVGRAATEAEAERIVVGLPLTLAGERGEAAQRAEAFADAIARRTGLPVELLDERLTSALSQRRLKEAGAKGGATRRTRERARARVDQGAAIALLEGWLARAARAAEGGAGAARDGR